jgi:hypothetical protein
MAKKNDPNQPTPTGFVMGDHRFFDPSQSGPIERFDLPPRQILGSPPPSFLKHIAREATADNPANKALRKGTWCGHGEPTFTAFDIVIDDHEELEISAIISEGEDEDQQIADLIAVRKPGGPWHALFRNVWVERQDMLLNTERDTCTAEESTRLNSTDVDVVRVAIGFEYPCDAQSADDATWMRLDLVLKGTKKPVTFVDTELA